MNNHEIPFPVLLQRTRKASGLSQSRLAARAGYDHSYVSRLEMDLRCPTRDAVLSFSAAMSCTDEKRDELLMSAGFRPIDDAALLGSEPFLVSAHAIISNRAVPPAVRHDLRETIKSAIRQAQRALDGAGVAATGTTRLDGRRWR